MKTALVVVPFGLEVQDRTHAQQELFITDFSEADKLAIDNTVLERNVPVSCDMVSGSTFPVGTSTVTCTATDGCGNSIPI